MTLAEFAAQLDGTLIGGDPASVVVGVSGYDTAQAGMVTYVVDERRLPAAEASPALAILVPPGISSSAKPIIQVAEPRAAFAHALRLFDWRPRPAPGIDSLASVAASARISPLAYIGPQVWVGEHVAIGDGCAIYPQVTIGDRSAIGPQTVIHAGVTIYPGCAVGGRVIIHAGAVIGADGLGFAPGPGGWEKIPHVGRVVIEDEVEIGANVTIDRATTGETVIGRGTKIDNLVHIAHNVKIGPACLIIAQVGIAGSAVLEEGVIIAGQGGVNDHVRIGAGARAAVRAGITRDVPAGMTVSGFPAQPHRDELKLEAALRRVPDLLKKIKDLEQRVAELESRLAPPEPG